jgi:predicted Asp-tRNA(Asn)/Glu-tRNA(Gln) amidotransferase subunit C
MMERKIDMEKIRKDAKLLLDKFAKTLETVEKEDVGETFIDREEFLRHEEDGRDSDPEFKEKVLENAPKHDSEFIIAEKGAWK